jgi:hypothetical protein
MRDKKCMGQADFDNLVVNETAAHPMPFPAVYRLYNRHAQEYCNAL